MARKKAIVTAQQVYQLPQWGPHARVTIDYDAENPPPFFQPGPGVVIVGEVPRGIGSYASAQVGSGDYVPPETDVDLAAARAALDAKFSGPSPRSAVVSPATLGYPSAEALGILDAATSGFAGTSNEDVNA